MESVIVEDAVPAPSSLIPVVSAAVVVKLIGVGEEVLMVVSVLLLVVVTAGVGAVVVVAVGFIELIMPAGTAAADAGEEASGTKNSAVVFP